MEKEIVQKIKDIRERIEVIGNSELKRVETMYPDTRKKQLHPSYQYAFGIRDACNEILELL